jgi:hypothetical protein
MGRATLSGSPFGEAESLALHTITPEPHHRDREMVGLMQQEELEQVADRL